MALDFEEEIEKKFRNDVMRAELLDAETELQLAFAWRDQRDEAALHRLTVAYIRMAFSMAMKFRHYGVARNDLIQEACLGVMKAAEKFDPDRGVRFSTYAVWWIKASIQNFVLRNWSIVRTGSTKNQKALFFNMRRVKAQIKSEASRAGVELSTHELHQKIASAFGVPMYDVVNMSGRLSGRDHSLNTPLMIGEEESREWIDTIEDEESLPPDEIVAATHDQSEMRELLIDLLRGLDERSLFIVQERKLRDPGRTLESLGQELGLSKERVRQLEAAAFVKMRNRLELNHHRAQAVRLFLGA